MKIWRLTLSLILAGSLPAAPAPTPKGYIAHDGKAGLVIVAGDDAGGLSSLAASELGKYLGALTDAGFEVRKAREVPRRAEQPMLLLGGPESNSLVREAIADSRNKLDFSGLSQDGFLLWKATVRGQPALIAGGSTDAANLYAAYDLLERLGITFLLVKDLIPEKRPTLELPEFRLKEQTQFTKRGFLISNIYPNRGIMNLSEVKTMLDQMAKMKLNYLEFFWFEHEPWIKFGFRGEDKLLGDATGPETGYMGWRYNYGSYLIKDLQVGRDLFGGRKKMAPMEFQDVETPEQAFETAKTFLREIIHYAKTKNIQVWLDIDPTTLPGSLARFSHRAENLQLPFHPILGTHMCPADAELHEMNENRLRALVETYPEAAGYNLYIPEMFPECKDDLNRNFLFNERPRWENLINLWAPYTGYERNPTVVKDSTSGSLHIVTKFLEARDRIAPQAHIGIGGIGRGFLLPIMDKIYPKSVPFSDMESSGVWTPTGVPMEYFGGLGLRERILVPRMDDDCCMFGMQFNIGLYEKDRVLSGSKQFGVTGLGGQLNRLRGMEVNYRYLAEGAWQPDITGKEFYLRYAERIFGNAAAKPMMEAFDILETNEKYLGWYQTPTFNCCGVIDEVATAYRYYHQPNPYDGISGGDGLASNSREYVRKLTVARTYLANAMTKFQEAAPSVAPHGKEELRYLINKTQSFAMLLETQILVRQGWIQLAEAFRARGSTPREQFVQKLDLAMELFEKGRKQGRATTEEFAKIIDHASDMGVLYRANLFLITGLELTEQTARNIVNYHHGKQYTTPVAWEKIYPGFPVFAPSY